MNEAQQMKRSPDKKRDGMARSRKKGDSPQVIQAPSSLVPLMQAFHVDSDEGQPNASFNKQPTRFIRKANTIPFQERS